MKTRSWFEMGVEDIDNLSVTDSGVFSDNDCSSGRSSPISCKEGVLGERERFSILTYDQVKRIDNVLNENVILEGRGNFPALELKLKDLLTAVKDRLVKEGLKIRDIRLNGGAASYALMPETLDYCYVCGYGYGSSSGNPSDSGLMCSCNVVANVAAAAEHCPSGGIMTVNGGAKSNCSYNDIDLIFGMELSTAKHFDRVKTAVLDALLDLLPPQVSRKRMSPCALKEAYVSKMVKVCEGDRWSLIALGNGQSTGSHGYLSSSPSSSSYASSSNSLLSSSSSSLSSSTSSLSSSTSGQNKSRGCSVELKFVDNMRRQYEFSVDSFQIVLDSLMLFYKCATVPMSGRFYPTVVGESVYGDFNEALFHLHHGLISTRSPEEIRGGGLLKYCNLLVRGYRPADALTIQPLQRYMCSRFFIDFSEVEQQEVKLRTYLANHMSGASIRLRYAFLITLYNVVNSSTVCLMSHERRLTLQLIQRLACQLLVPANDYGSSLMYPYITYYMPQTAATATQSCHYNGNTQTVYYNTALYQPVSSSTSSPSTTSSSHKNFAKSNSSSSNSTTTTPAKSKFLKLNANANSNCNSSTIINSNSSNSSNNTNLNNNSNNKSSCHSSSNSAKFNSCNSSNSSVSKIIPTVHVST